MKPATKILLLVITIFIIRLPAVAAQEPTPVLAFYYAWYDQNTWTSGQSVDLPALRYRSADRATIERHVAQAQSAGLTAFVQSWLGPQVENNQTETNFRTLLDVAQARGFNAAVDFETTSPFLADSGAVTAALSTLLATHAQHPAYLRYQGKPIIFFWRQQRFTVDEWRNIRNQVDPNRTTHWIAEGVDIEYQAIFDGHHLYSIAWADSPAGQMAKWGDRVRSYESENSVDRLWVATAMPGYDDTRLPRADAFSVSRRNGDYYRESWQGALASQPDMLIITSFNEWPEGTHLEPSESYGNRYLNLTRELVTALRGTEPAAPPPDSLVFDSPAETETQPEAAQQPPPAEPYIQTIDLTNVRAGPSTTLEVVGRLPANTTAPVIGQAQGWWQIEFEAGPDEAGWVFGEVVDFLGDDSQIPQVDTPPAPAEEVAAATEEEPAPAPATEETTEAAPVVEIPEGGVNIRTGPGLEFEQLGRLEAGATAPVVAKNESGDWWQIEYAAGDDGLAWVAAVVVNFVGDPESVPPVSDLPENGVDPEADSPALPEPVIDGTVEATDPVNLRAEPSLDGLLVGGLYPGETAAVQAISPDGDWWLVEFAGAPEQSAWVAAEFVRFTGQKNSIPIFGVGTVTPTPGPTNTPTPTPRATATPTIPAGQPTFAPTATSIYQATSEALMASRGTPEAVPSGESSPTAFTWGDIPWGILSVLVIAGFFWYQFIQRRRR